MDDDAGRECACDVAIPTALSGSRRVVFVAMAVRTAVLISGDEWRKWLSEDQRSDHAEYKRYPADVQFPAKVVSKCAGFVAAYCRRLRYGGSRDNEPMKELYNSALGIEYPACCGLTYPNLRLLSVDGGVV
jgi:hypothetical protein